MLILCYFSLQVSNFDKQFMKSRLRDSEFSSYKGTGKTLEKIVILNRKDYICKMKIILYDKSKFQKVYRDHDKTLNHLTHVENPDTVVLKNLRDKKEVSIEQYTDLNPSSATPEIMYGSAKVHKIVKDGLPSFRPILSAIGIPTCKLTKLLVPMLETLPINEYSIKYSFTFSKEL